MYKRNKPTTFYYSGAFLLFILLTGCKPSSQVIKASQILRPQSGMLVFSEIGTITDTLLYEKSVSKFLKNFKAEMFNQIVSEREALGKTIDSATTELVIENMSLLVRPILFDKRYKTDSIKVHSHKYVDSLIIEEKAQRMLGGNERRVINRHDSTYIMQTNSGIGYTESVKLNYKPSQKNITSYNEYRNEKKIIKDYDCFKIVVKISNTDSDDILPGFILESDTELTMYVTEQILSSYHPVIKLPNVLNRYFPLEIIERNDVVDGAHLVYYNEDFSLK